MSPERAAPTHPALELALETYRREELRRPDPIVAILGPAGSGKTSLLRALLAAKGQKNGPQPWTSLAIDLSGIPIGTEDEMYEALLARLEDSLLDAGIPAQVEARLDPARKIDALIVRAARQTAGHLILALDHLDCVPRAFADSVSQRLRALKESSDTVPETGTLSLLISATISLSELAPSSKSAFQGARVIQLPIQDPVRVRQHIEAVLLASGFASPAVDAVELLMRETWGEPCFLDAILTRLRTAGEAALVGEAVITRTIEALDSSEVPHLRHAALHLHFNHALLDIAQKLLSGKRVPRRGQAIDIDEFQLTGVVVLDGRTKPPAYTMRNGIVERLARRFGNGEPAEPYETDLRRVLRDLCQARESILAATELPVCATALQAAWKNLTSLDPAELHIALSDSTFSRREIFDLAGGTGDPPAGAARAAAGAFHADESAFDADADSVSYAFPLPAPPDIRCWLVSTSDRSRGAFTELSLLHWRAFLLEVAPGLVRAALAEAGRRGLVARKPQTPAVARESQATSQLYLNLRSETAVLLGPADVRQIQGRFDSGWSERVQDLDRDLLKGRDSREDFERMVERSGADLEKVIADMKGLKELLVDQPNSQNWVIASPIAGMKLPFELLRAEADKTALLLKTGIARRIEGFLPPADLRRPFTGLLNRLRQSGESLRVLLAGTDPSGELPIEEELKQVRRNIELGAAALNLKCDFTDVVEEKASPAALQKALTRDRPFHLFHFCGHANQAQGGRAFIRLNDRGKAQDVTSDQLKAWLLDAGIWLCYLSACQTAAVGGDSLLVSSGMFEDILGAGVPNLVGFRWPVTARSSIALAAAFYERLLEAPGGSDPSVAMLYARRAARGIEGVSDAWASSVVVTQCPL
jgi:hypothetical protein